MPRVYGTTNFQNAAAAPASPQLGDTYYDTTSNTPFVWNGTLWQPLGGGGSAQPIATANFSVTANTGLSNAAAGTTLPLTLNEVQGSDISIVGGNTLQFNAAGTYHVVMNVTVSATAACWFIVMANLPGGVSKRVVGACIATPWFDEATLSFNYLAAAGDQVTFSIQANIATGATCDARSVGSATKVTVGPGPTGPQGPPGPQAGATLLGQWQRTTDITQTGNVETMALTTGLFTFPANRTYEIRGSAALSATTVTTRILARIYNITDGLRAILVDNLPGVAGTASRWTAPYIFRPGAADRQVEFQLTFQAATAGTVTLSGTAPNQGLLQVWDIGTL